MNVSVHFWQVLLALTVIGWVALVAWPNKPTYPGAFFSGLDTMFVSMFRLIIGLSATVIVWVLYFAWQAYANGLLDRLG